MSDYSKILYHAVIEYLTVENIQTQQIHNWMTVVFGEDASSYTKVKHWVAEFH